MRMVDMELKGQTVYVVNTFNRDDILQGYRIFADRADAVKYANAENRKGEKYGDYAYVESSTIK
jgi:hypothetical protein